MAKQPKVQTAFEKADVFAMIEEGVTKNAKSPNYSPNIGTFLTRMDIMQTACVAMFRKNPDLQKAYLKKNGGNKVASGRAEEVIFGDEVATPTPTQEVEIEDYDDFEEDVQQELADAEPIEEAEVVQGDGLEF